MLLLAIIAVATAAGLDAAQNFSDPGIAAKGPFQVINNNPPLGTLTFYPTRALFQSANPGLPTETFAGTSVPPGTRNFCTPPLNSTTNDACFAAGSVIPGFSLSITVDGGANEYVVLNAALGLPCVAVGPNGFVDEPNFDLSPAVKAVAFDLFTPLGGGEPFTVEAFGPGGSLGSAPITGGGTSASFFGVDTSDPGGITRIEIREGIDKTGDLYCNLEFGGAVPVELQSLEIE